jgi:hypothetical protein
MVDNQSTQSFTQVGHQVSVHMKLKIGMRSVILFRFVQEERKDLCADEKNRK